MCGHSSSFGGRGSFRGALSVTQPFVMAQNMVDLPCGLICILRADSDYTTGVLLYIVGRGAKEKHIQSLTYKLLISADKYLVIMFT